MLGNAGRLLADRGDASRSPMWYLSTPTRASGLLLGAAFAMVWRPNAVMRGKLGRRSARLDAVAIIGLAALAILIVKVSYLKADPSGAGIVADSALMRGGFLWTALATLAVLGALVHRRSYETRAGDSAVVVAGYPVIRSLSLPLADLSGYSACGRCTAVGGRVCVAMVSRVIAEVSYRYLEMPIRRAVSLRQPPVPKRGRCRRDGLLACWGLSEQ